MRLPRRLEVRLGSREGESPGPIDLSSSHLESKLSALRPKRALFGWAPRRAAVAVLVRYLSERPEVLLMRRAERQGDRWSGHVSFPGGRSSQADGSLLDTAIRETLEEVGIDLTRVARLIGRLDELTAVAGGEALPMSITPFVFLLSDPTADCALSDEAVSVFWLPLAEVASGALSGTHVWRFGPLDVELPCWRFEGHLIWGLTHRMLTQLLRELSR
ncbi:MAG: CoA pyrophosphatase [Deltaproteobacteria bacterium]|nr:CoA pyrophosphatase [Deltaproteobacteria bacterium]